MVDRGALGLRPPSPSRLPAVEGPGGPQSGERVDGRWVPAVGARAQETSFIKTTYDISLDSQISLLPLGFSLLASSPLVTVFDWDARENPEVTRNLTCQWVLRPQERDGGGWRRALSLSC